MSGEKNWQASVIEHRAAWITAACCLLIILTVSLKPDLFTASEQVVEAAQPEMQAERSRPEAPAIEDEQEVIEPEPAAEPIKPKPVIAPSKPAVKKDIAKQPIIKAVPSADEPSGGYYVQLGAFKERPRAQGVIDQLKRHGWNGVLSQKSSGLYAVWAGPEAQRAGADKLQIAIAKKMKTRGFIVHQKGR